MKINELSHLFCLYRAANDEGAGIPLGLAHHTPEEAIKAEGWELLLEATESDPAIARRHDGAIVAVGQTGSGPWAVTVEEK